MGKILFNKFLFALSGLALLSGCVTQSISHGVNELYLKDHVLVDKIWSVKGQRFIDKQTFSKIISESEYLLLGETHDNQVHHQGQVWAIQQLHQKGRSAQVAFEMINQAQGKFIEDKSFDSAEDLIVALAHVKASWDYEHQYRGIFATVIESGYPVYPANLDRSEIMAMARKGLQAVPAKLKVIINENPLPEEQQAASRKEIEGSHCGMINNEMTTAMMLIQRVKDALMTESITADTTLDTRVLVAGSGHVRTDRGVPFYLKSEFPTARVTTVAWLEVEKELKHPEQYAQAWQGETLPFDYVWFTPRVNREDPCIMFRQHMKKKAISEKDE